MSDPEADSAPPAIDYATGEFVTAPSNEGAATTSDSGESGDDGGQEQQGDQSNERRLNGLMSLAQKRTAERDQALNEVEALRLQLNAQVQAEQSSMQGISQAQAMYPERYATEPEPEPEQPAPKIRIDLNAAPRQDLAARTAASRPSIPESSPVARFAGEQRDIARMKQSLNVLGSQWVRQAQESGLLND